MLALAGGIEPPTHCLQGSCSAPELRQHRQNSTLVSKWLNVKDFLCGLALPDRFVAEGGDGRTDIQGPDLPGHRDRQQRIAGPGDQGPDALTLAAEDQAERAFQVDLPGSDPTVDGGAINPNAGFFDLFQC